MPPWFIIGLGAAAVALWASVSGKKKPGARDDEGGGDERGEGRDDEGSGAAEGEYVIPGEWLGQYNSPYNQQKEQQQKTAGSWDGASYSEVYTDPGPAPYGGFTTENTPGSYDDSGYYYFDQTQYVLDAPVAGLTPQGVPLIDLPTWSSPAPQQSIGGGSGTSPQKPILMPEE